MKRTHFPPRPTCISVITGIVVGIGAGMGLARLLAAQLFGVKPNDFWSLAAPLLCILLTAMVASVPPVFRAANSDPLGALRYE